MGSSIPPFKLDLVQKDNSLEIKAVSHSEWSAEKDTLIISSRILFKFGEKTNEINSREVWTLFKRGKKLEIVQTADGFRGRGPSTPRLVYIRF